ncbi:Uncharacterized protein Fot_22561 [Forsythia ovata]|uniref:Uncharacterized protein n=1 Tax=Forsythia ovata TaxID=205694 RepID=A0ABD1UY38_9LAMI
MERSLGWKTGKTQTEEQIGTADTQMAAESEKKKVNCGFKRVNYIATTFVVTIKSCGKSFGLQSFLQFKFQQSPLSLRYSLKTNRVVVPSLSQTSQSPNTSIPPTRKNGTQSTIETIPTCSTPLIETLCTHTQLEASSRTLPNPSAQYGHSSDNLDRPHSSHPGCEQGSGVGRLPRTPDDVPTRGSCKQIKTSRIMRSTQEKIRVLYNSVSRRAISSRVHSLLVHDIGAIIRSHCPMNMCYWRTISSSEKKDLMDEITTNFEIDSKDLRLMNYVNRLYNGRYREFKAELSAYYKLQKTHKVALTNPPLEMLDRGVDQWVELCNHFNTNKFRKVSLANIENWSKKKYNHRTGSRTL